MEKQFRKLRGRGDERREEASAEGVKYPPHIKEKLDNALAKIVDAKDDETRLAAMKEYKGEMGEVKEQFELVDFNGEKIHRFELEALNQIVAEINEDYAKQRLVNSELEIENIDIDSITIEIKDNSIFIVDLDKKQLTQIPKTIGNLSNLQKLHLNENHIAEIFGLDNLTNLREISLNDNQITEITGLDNLTNLQNLYLDRNQITEITGLDNLTNLQNLYLNGNQITEISGLDNLTNLEELGLHGNPIDKIINKDQIDKLRERSVSIMF